MIGRLALRSLTAHPIRTAVLATGFGAGVAVMAILLGVAEIVLRQAQSPALVGGGDVLIQLAPQVPARLVLAGTLQSDDLRPRIRAASPFDSAPLFLITNDASVRLTARAGIPSLERAIGDAEIAGASAWRDSPADMAWTHESPEVVLRQVDRFHPIPDAPRWRDSWAEWLYFNGRAGDARFYLTFLAGPRGDDGRRASGVRLQLDRGAGVETFSSLADLTDENLSRAPDLTIGACSVRLVGMEYRIRLDLRGESGRRVTGELSLLASAGRLVPPIEISGVNGWMTGYVVPVMSGPLSGELVVDSEPVSFAGGTGYHDHNWGFWEGVSWQWGQVQQRDLSLIYGRVFAPAEAADPERLPAFVGVLGSGGPLAYATSVRIEETNDAAGRPLGVDIRARGPALDLRIGFEAESAIVNRAAAGGIGSRMDFLQMRGTYTVRGRAGARSLDFTAPGAAETFRGR
jgi:hypothetical protein